jgi:hypothetical protein
MLDLIKKVRDHLLADSTITDLVDERIYWSFSPTGNTQGDFPQITLMDFVGETDSVLKTYDARLMIHIWTKGDGKSTLANEIEKRILLSLDIESFLATPPCIYQIWKLSSVGSFEDDSQTLHKIITFNVVMDGYQP